MRLWHINPVGRMNTERDFRPRVRLGQRMSQYTPKTGISFLKRETRLPGGVCVGIEFV